MWSSCWCKKGFRLFKAATARAAQLMCGNAATAPHVDAISPRQWNVAYNAIAEGHEGTGQRGKRWAR